jgi:hypothetical protein
MHRFRIPNHVITDLGSRFTAIEFRNWTQDCGISKDYASVAHPEANRQVERANGLILAGLKPRLYEELEDYGSKWIEKLSKVIWGLRTQVSRATGYLPFFLVYGSEAMLPADLIWTSQKSNNTRREKQNTPVSLEKSLRGSLCISRIVLQYYLVLNMRRHANIHPYIKIK